MVNRVILVGRLGRDPEVRSTPSGQSVCNFSIATTEKFKDRSGESQEKTEWHNIVVWGKLADICGQYIGKGSLIYLEGKLTTRSYENKEGNKEYRTEVVAQTIQFLDSRRSGQGNNEEVGGDKDIPF